MRKAKKGTILLVAFSRPKLLSQVLESIQTANSSSLPILVIFQKGNNEVLEILEKNLTSKDYLFQVPGESRTTVNNISFNRFLGYDFAFQFLESEYVLAFEDDVLVSKDILYFSEYIFDKYQGNKRFRGINFGSHESYSLESSNLYSLQRFGIHGPASGITASTWAHFKNQKLIEKAKQGLFDGIFEPFIRSGFMVTPTNSRFLDLGIGGTHTSSNATDPYFERMQKSFVGNFVLNKEFQIHKAKHSWRSDVFSYSKWENPLFDVLSFLGERRNFRFFRKLERAVYKVFILPRTTNR